MPTITDNFTRADADALGSSSEGWSWTEVSGDADIVSNEAKGFSTGHHRAESDLGSATHYASMTPTGGGNGYGPIVRFDASANSGYVVVYDTSQTRLFKCLSGSLSFLGTFSTNYGSVGGVLKLTASDDDLEAFAGATSLGVISGDTDLPTQTRVGFRLEPNDRITDFQGGTLGGGGYSLSVDFGTYTITGSVAALKAARKIASVAGSYSTTGQAATPKAARKIAAAAGSYSTTGSDSVLKRGLRLAAVAGSYASTGLDAALSKAGSAVMDAVAGLYGLTGSAANLIVTRRMSASAGSYSTTGSITTFGYARRLAAAFGSYVLSGVSALLSRSVVLTSAPTLDGTVYVATDVDAIVRVNTDQSGNVRIV